MYTLYIWVVESSCAYWIPLEDWRGETMYIEAMGVDYIARLPGCADPVRWYSQFPQLSAARDIEAEERSHIDMMIALDNWNWMLIRQACHITGRQDKEEIDEARFLAQTQFGKRLVLLNSADAYEIIPPEGEEEWYVGGQQVTHNNHRDAGAGGEKGCSANGTPDPGVLQGGRDMLPTG
jgi:hypothetical protein